MTQHIPCSSASRMASSAWCALRLGRNPKESLSNSAYARKLGSLLARRYSARCNSRSFSGVLSVATIPSSFLAEVASSSRAPSLQRLSPPSSVLRTRPTPRPARPPQLAALCVRTRSLTASRGLPRSAHSLRGVPSLLPRESATGVIETARRVLPSPIHEGLGLSIWTYGATSGFAARYGPSLRSRRVAARRRPGPASAGRLAATRRGPRYPNARFIRGGLLSSR